MKNKKIISIFISFMLAITVVFSSMASVSEAATNQAQTAQSGKYVFYASGNKIRRVNLETRTYKTMKTFASDSYIEHVSVKDGWIYFSKQVINSDYEVEVSIYRMKTDASECKRIASGATMPVVYGSKVYYMKCKYNGDTGEAVSTGIYKMNLTGSSKAYIKKSSRMSEFKVYKSRIYYTYTNSSETKMYLKSMKLDASDLKTHDSSEGATIQQLIPYSGYVYYNNNDAIYKLDTTTFKKSLHKSNALLLGKDKAGTYYLDGSTINLYRKTATSSKILVKKFNDEEIPIRVQPYGDYILVDMLTSDFDIKTIICTKSGKSVKSIGKYDLLSLI